MQVKAAIVHWTESSWDLLFSDANAYVQYADEVPEAGSYWDDARPSLRHNSSYE